MTTESIGHIYAEELARVHRRIDEMERKLEDHRKTIEKYSESIRQVVEAALLNHEKREEEKALHNMQLLIKDELYDFYSHVHGVNLRDENERNRYANDQRLKTVISGIIRESSRTIIVKVFRLIIVLIAISVALTAANISVSSLFSLWLKG